MHLCLTCLIVPIPPTERCVLLWRLETDVPQWEAYLTLEAVLGGAWEDADASAAPDTTSVRQENALHTTCHHVLGRHTPPYDVYHH